MSSTWSRRTTPSQEAAELVDAAFPLDSWAASADPAAEGYGHAASWAFISELSAVVGPDALRTVLVRVASSIGPYAETEVDADPPADGAPPQVPLTTPDLPRSPRDGQRAPTSRRPSASGILTEADVALLPVRAEARAAFDELVARRGRLGRAGPGPRRDGRLAIRRGAGADRGGDRLARGA